MVPLTYITTLLLYLITAAAAADIINTLPGYPDTLPFHLETGYVGVGEDEQVQLFYYFVESERDPDKDPLVLWLTGGPGCSGSYAFLYVIGPLRFDLQSFDGSLPNLILNPYSWTKVANIIFIDSPVGTGFSYATTPEGYHSSDTNATIDYYTFLKKWFSIHPRFVKNRLYIAGDTYGAKIVTLLALEIANGNDGGLEQRMNLKGYFIGNPSAESDLDSNERVPYAHRMALISDEYFELAKSSCKGNYIKQDPSNTAECRNALHLCNECTKNINTYNILDPNCNLVSPKRDYILEDDPDDFLLMFKQEEQWCRNNNYSDSAVWLNDQTVQEALYIRKGTIQEWIICKSLSGYEHNVASVIQYHQMLNQKGFQSLVYSGDHDMTVPYIGTLKWIRSLNLTIEDNWRPWTVDGQVAGYTEKYKNGEAYITFATVKGAGHIAPEYMPKQCLAMIKRWLNSFPL